MARKTIVEKSVNGAKGGDILEPVGNGGLQIITAQTPYRVIVQVQGVAPLLMHGWNIEAIETKGKAAKGSQAKKTDDLESYVYRLADGTLALTGDCLRAACAEYARFIQDPRSPRKSARDLVKAALIPLVPLASLGVKDWDFVARHRVLVQRQAITRSRPALNIGWVCTFDMMVNLPEYMPEDTLMKLVSEAGRICGLGGYRPTYGRFVLKRFERIEFAD